MPDHRDSLQTQAKNPKYDRHLCPDSGLNEEGYLEDSQGIQKDVGTIAEQNYKRLYAGFDVVRTILLQVLVRAQLIIATT
jgi:hypothetical protein